MVKIFLDPGHGGADPGAVGNGLEEKNLTLKIALALRNILLTEYQGVSVLMSRTTDATVSLAQRTNAANRWGAEYYLSIHINAGGGTGFESFIYPGVGSPTTNYQTNIHDEVIKQTNFRNRGKKMANFHVLRESNMPALLTENGFIDNANDANKLKSASFLNSIARGHAEGLAKAFNIKKKPITPTKLYRVQIGAFKVKDNAEKLAQQARAKGFNTIVVFKQNLYKVQIGAYSIQDNAKTQANKAKNAGFNAYIYYE